MADIIRLEERRPPRRQDEFPIIKKVVEGQIVECIDIDALSSIQQTKYFGSNKD
jgi:hypothetical protein